MNYTRMRMIDNRCTSKWIGQEGYTPTVFYKTYKWGSTRRARGLFKYVLDTPNKLKNNVFPESHVTRITKGIDPSATLSALDVSPLPNGFCVTCVDGKVDVPIWESVQRASNGLYTRFYGDNPILRVPAPVDVENLVATPTTYFEPVTAKAQFVMAKALSKMGEPQNDYAVPIAELKETLKFLVSPIKALLALNAKRNLLDSVWAVKRNGGIRFVSHPDRSLRDHFKRREWGKDLRNAPSHISDYWLSYRYGMEPLIRDCDTVLEHAWHGIGHTRGVFSKRSRLVEKSKTAVTSSLFYLDPAINVRVVDTIETTDTHRAYVRARRRVLGGYWEEMLDMGFNPFSVPSIAWELLPLSFVLDRFVNIGDWISACTYRPDTTYLGNLYSRRKQVTLTRVAVELTHHGFKRAPQALGKHTWSFDNYVRLPNLGLPATPVWNPRALNLGQWIDHLTILWQRMPKFVKE